MSHREPQLLRVAALIVALPLATIAGPTSAQAQATLPEAATQVTLDEHLGQRLPMGLRFRDPTNRQVVLGDYFRDGKPVVMVLSYYECPMLCGLVLQGMVNSLAQLTWKAGDEYRVLAVSIDPRDRPEQAEKKQRSALAAIGRAGRAGAWPFLVGEASETAALADAIGFRYQYDPQTSQYAHPAAIYVLTPDGRISRYLYGVTYGALDLRLALVEAANGRVGSIVDRVILSCYRYDPATRRYGPTILGFFRLGGALILASVSTLLAPLFVRDRQRRRAPREPGGEP